MVAAFGLCLTLASAPASGAAAATSTAWDTSVTTVFVVRHAEKNTAWAGPDPPLSEAGRARAAALAYALADAHVDVIYATRFLRARATAQPLATLMRDSIEVVDQDHPAALAARIWSQNRGHAVLVVGHGDTVPAMVQSLGGGALELSSGDFGALIVIQRRGAEPPHVLHLRYGAP